MRVKTLLYFCSLTNKRKTNMKRLLTILMACVATGVMATETFTISVKNASRDVRKDVPVVLKLADYASYPQAVRSAVVTVDGNEIACQLDDLNRDGRYDELCFLTDLGKNEKKTFEINLSEEESTKKYVPRTFSELLLRNPKVKIKNKHDLFMKEMTVERGVNPYAIVHHHGVAFESELVGFRIYFDHRQTVDAYGKFKKQLEIRETQFYTDENQKAAGYGDDVLWVGSSYGVGALRGWDGENQLMLEDVERRTQRVISSGPVRSIVELVDEDWRPVKDLKPITMRTRYTIYGGHRDVQVDIHFDRNASGYDFATGIINVKNSKEFSDKKGLRGCWGTDWPVGVKDTAGHKMETVGLGVIVPQKYIRKEKPADEVNYTYVVGTDTQDMTYYVAFASDNEEFVMHSEKEWFEFLKQWKREINNEITIKKE